jgi:hypothetical protein
MKLLKAILKTIALLFVILLALFVGDVVDMLLKDAGFNHFKLLVFAACCIYLVANEYFGWEGK